MNELKFKYIKTTQGKDKVFLLPGLYKIECWGAQGGSGLEQGNITAEGGRGAYVSGFLSIHKNIEVYIYVGGKGENGNAQPNTHAKGGFNGGGNGGADTNDDEATGGGGGATDLRLIDDNDEGLNYINSIKSRIIVAAGGSSSVYNKEGAPGGDLTGYILTNDDNYVPSTTNQAYGYKLGIGEDGKDYNYIPSGGAGAGYWGGLSGESTTNSSVYKGLSSSGSSFILGYPGSDSSNLKNFNNFIFQNAIIKNGLETFNSPFGYEENGHKGDGAIVISLLKLSYFTIKSNQIINLSLIFILIIMKK